MIEYDRRGFLTAVGLGGLALTAPLAAAAPMVVQGGGAVLGESEQRAMLISTVGEGLMYEHGFVNRLLSVYAECADRLEAGKEVPPGALLNAGALVDEFVESYHEAFEERNLYPLFARASAMHDLVAVLSKQHGVGRQLVQQTIFLAGKDMKAPDVPPKLITICRSYVRMYREHAARETTDVLPALVELGGDVLMAQMHTRMMSLRKDRLGGLDLAGVREKLTAIEKTLGMDNLDSFTAAVPT